MKRVLVIRPGALGDTLLTLPVLQALRQQAFPEKLHIKLVSHPAILELAQAWGIAEKTDNYSAVRWSELFSPIGIHSLPLYEELVEMDLVICWLRDSEGLVEHNLHAIGCKKVIVAPGRPTDEIHTRIHIVKYLGHILELNIDETIPFKLTTGLTPLQQARKDANMEKRPEMVAIHPGSGGTQKCWPIEQFAKIIQELQHRQTPTFLLSGPVDEERTKQLRKLLKNTKQGLTNVRILENAPLSEICQELLVCRCYLGNDAGMTHLAALFGLPTIVLFGPSNPYIWRPVGNQVSVITKSPLELLRHETVMQSLYKYL